jgi:Zn-dependent peptidase ImmA (M78 family)
MEEAESRIGAAVSKWEAGELEPTVRQLREACRVYKRPLAAFFLTIPPTTFRVPHDYRRLPGELEPRLSPEFLGEFRAARYRRRIALEVASEGEIPEEISNLIGSVTTKTRPEKACAGYRDKLVERMSKTSWSSRYDAFNSWREAIEHFGVLVSHFSGVKVREVRGYAITDTPLPLIGLNSSDSVNGRIFTLLHEFAHLLLGKPGVSNLKEYPSVISADQRIEQWCNAFAAEVLVPTSVFMSISDVKDTSGERMWDDDDLSRLASKFFVSRDVILGRLLTFGKVSSSFYWSKLEEYRKAAEEASSESGGFIRHHQKIVRGVGKPFARIVVGAYDREAITASDLAEYLGMRLKHLGNVRTALSPSRAGTGDVIE